MPCVALGVSACRASRGVTRGRARGQARRRSRSRASTARDVRRELARAVVGGGWGLLELRPMRMSLEEIFLQLTTEERSAGSEDGREVSPCVTSSRSRDKELRAYFASPIAYIVIGFFALLFGWFFYVYPALCSSGRACRWRSRHGRAADERRTSR